MTQQGPSQRGTNPAPNQDDSALRDHKDSKAQPGGHDNREKRVERPTSGDQAADRQRQDPATSGAQSGTAGTPARNAGGDGDSSTDGDQDDQDGTSTTGMKGRDANDGEKARREPRPSSTGNPS